MSSKIFLTLLLVTLIATSYATKLPTTRQVSSVDSRMKEMDAKLEQESQIEFLRSEHALDTEKYEAEMISSDENKTMRGIDEKKVVRKSKNDRKACRAIEHYACFRARKCWRKRTRKMKAFCNKNCIRIAKIKCR